MFSFYTPLHFLWYNCDNAVLAMQYWLVFCVYLQNKTVKATTAANECHNGKSVFSLAPVSVAERGMPLCAPRVRIERKLFPHVSDQPSFSTTSSTATSDSRDFSDPLHSEQLLQSASSGERVSFGTHVSATVSSGAGDQTPVQLTPKEAPSPLTPFLPNVPPNSPRGGGSHVDSAAFSVTLPRCKKDTQKFFAGTDQPGVFGCYGPTMTIDRKCKTQPRPIPPVPPVRRLPSWVLIILSFCCSYLLHCIMHKWLLVNRMIFLHRSILIICNINRQCFDILPAHYCCYFVHLQYFYLTLIAM